MSVVGSQLPPASYIQEDFSSRAGPVCGGKRNPLPDFACLWSQGGAMDALSGLQQPPLLLGRNISDKVSPYLGMDLVLLELRYLT